MIGVLDRFAGLAGDMFLAALLDAGPPLGEVRASLSATGLPNWELRVEEIVDHGPSVTRVHVDVGIDGRERRPRELVDLVSRAMPAPVAAARAAMGALARAEARLHGVDEESVHLREIGGHDTVVDIVGVRAGLHHRGVHALHVVPSLIGRGTVTTRYGVRPFLPQPPQRCWTDASPSFRLAGRNGDANCRGVHRDARRSYLVERHVGTRRVITVDLEGRPVRVRVGPHSAKPEHDDVASVAAVLDLPPREVARRAIEEAGRR